MQQKYGKWTILEEKPSQGKGKIAICQCDCGTLKEMPKFRVANGYTSKCRRCALKDSKKQFNLRENAVEFRKKENNKSPLTVFLKIKERSNEC